MMTCHPDMRVQRLSQAEEKVRSTWLVSWRPSSLVCALTWSLKNPLYGQHLSASIRQSVFLFLVSGPKSLIQIQPFEMYKVFPDSSIGQRVFDAKLDNYLCAASPSLNHATQIENLGNDGIIWSGGMSFQLFNSHIGLLFSFERFDR